MLYFDDILRVEGIPVEKTKLARHSSTTGIGAYRLWKLDRPRFEKYQALQDRYVFDPGSYVASFIVPPSRETLFAGLYEVMERIDCAEGTICANDGVRYAAGDAQWHTMRLLPKLSEYIEKLVIDWPNPRPTFVHRATVRKAVLEIRREVSQPRFPGFEWFYCNVDEVASLPETWREVLRSVWGVYVLVCNTTGKKYVGSAYGDEGLYGRLLDYKNPQDPGHRRLVPHDREHNQGKGYRCSVLSVISRGVSTSEVVDLERRWKERLRTCDTWGLNYN